VGLVSKEMVLQRVKSHVLLEVGSMYQVGRTFADCNVRMSPGGGVSRNALAHTLWCRQVLFL
jgi:hypothetical protein